MVGSCPPGECRRVPAHASGNLDRVGSFWVGGADALLKLSTATDSRLRVHKGCRFRTHQAGRTSVTASTGHVRIGVDAADDFSPTRCDEVERRIELAAAIPHCLWAMSSVTIILVPGCRWVGASRSTSRTRSPARTPGRTSRGRARRSDCLHRTSDRPTGSTPRGLVRVRCLRG